MRSPETSKDEALEARGGVRQRPRRDRTPAFHRAVFRLVRQIPRGRVVTYGQVAAILGHPRAARAVGTALRMLPPMLVRVVPWQRVLNSAGHISYRGRYPPAGPATRVARRRRRRFRSQWSSGSEAPALGRPEARMAHQAAPRVRSERLSLLCDTLHAAEPPAMRQLSAMHDSRAPAPAAQWCAAACRSSRCTCADTTRRSPSLHRTAVSRNDVWLDRSPARLRSHDRAPAGNDPPLLVALSDSAGASVA